MKRRACSSSRTRSSLIHAGRGRFSAAIGDSLFANHKTTRACTRGGGSVAVAPPLTESIAPRLLLFCWVLDVFDLVKLDIFGRVVEFLDPDVHVLHDIGRVRIDRNRSARALPLHALGSRNQRLSIGLAVTSRALVSLGTSSSLKAMMRHEPSRTQPIRAGATPSNISGGGQIWNLS